MSNIKVSSEISPLKKVIVHTPGDELEQMTPETAVELLYDDILNKKMAKEQHRQLKSVLSAVAQPLEVKDLLEEILKEPKIKRCLIEEMCKHLSACEVKNQLLEMPPAPLAAQLIAGTPLKINTLEKFLSHRHFSLPPLPNLFFTRDSSMVVNDRVLIGNMANKIRIAEALIMSHIFRYHPDLQCEDFIVDATKENMPNATFEGGDLLVLQEDTLLIGMSERTSANGIDYLLEEFKNSKNIKHIFVVILPKIRATIHLDMVFTMIDHDKAVVYPPLILSKGAVDVIHINIVNPDKPKFKRLPYLLEALRRVNIHLEPVNCGGENELYQKREQWQSGANYFTMGPGKIIGYGMNENTFKALTAAGIPRIEANDVINGKVDLNRLNKYAVAISGGELTRGGGGCRCMTMPILRD
jgi:arginine deiminase